MTLAIDSLSGARGRRRRFGPINQNSPALLQKLTAGRTERGQIVRRRGATLYSSIGVSWDSSGNFAGPSANFFAIPQGGQDTVIGNISPAYCNNEQPNIISGSRNWTIHRVGIGVTMFDPGSDSTALTRGDALDWISNNTAVSFARSNDSTIWLGTPGRLPTPARSSYQVVNAAGTARDTYPQTSFMGPTQMWTLAQPWELEKNNNINSQLAVQANSAPSGTGYHDMAIVLTLVLEGTLIEGL